MANDPEIQITIDDIREEDVYALLYHQPLWPDIVGDGSDDGRSS